MQQETKETAHWPATPHHGTRQGSLPQECLRNVIGTLVLRKPLLLLHVLRHASVKPIGWSHLQRHLLLL
jgi:hypothetical protein